MSKRQWGMVFFGAMILLRFGIRFGERYQRRHREEDPQSAFVARLAQEVVARHDWPRRCDEVRSASASSAAAFISELRTMLTTDEAAASPTELAAMANCWRDIATHQIRFAVPSAAGEHARTALLATAIEDLRHSYHLNASPETAAELANAEAALARNAL